MKLDLEDQLYYNVAKYAPNRSTPYFFITTTKCHDQKQLDEKKGWWSLVSSFRRTTVHHGWKARKARRLGAQMPCTHWRERKRYRDRHRETVTDREGEREQKSKRGVEKEEVRAG